MATASASRGTSRPCSRASACRSSPTTRSGRTIRRRCSASPRNSRQKYPNTTLALTKALIRAGHVARRQPERQSHEGGRDPGAPEYVGADKEVIANSMTGTFEYEKGDKRAGAGLQRVLPLLRDLSLLLRRHLVSHADAPLGADRRAEVRPAGSSTRRRASTCPTSICRPPSSSSTKGTPRQRTSPSSSDGFKEPTPAADVIDGVPFDGRKPNAYLESLSIGLKGNAAALRRRCREQLNSDDANGRRSVAPPAPSKRLQETINDHGERLPGSGRGKGPTQAANRAPSSRCSIARPARSVCSASGSSCRLSR